MRRYAPLIRSVATPRTLTLLCAAGALILVASAASAALPLLLGRVIDDLVRHRAVLAEILAMGALAMLSSVAFAFGSYAFTRFAQYAETRLALLCYLRVMAAETSAVAEGQAGTIINRIRDDVPQLAAVLEQVAMPMVASIFAIALSITGVAFLNIKLTAALSLTLALWIVCARFCMRGFRTAQRAALERDDHYQSVLLDRLTALPYIQLRVAAAEHIGARAFLRRLRDRLAVRRRLAFLQGLSASVNGTLTGLAMPIVLAVGTPLLWRDELSIGQLTAFIALSGRIMQPLSMLVNLQTQLTRLDACARRVTELLEIQRDGGTVRSAVRWDIEFVGVGLRGHADWLFRALAMKIPEGAIILLSGPNGSGKSSLCRTLVRLKNADEGSVRMAGVPVQEWNPSALRRSVRYVTKDVHLFGATVKENIDLLSGVRSSQHEAWAALQTFDMAHVVRNMSAALETPLSADCSVLSAGERERFQLASVLLAAPRVCIIDEATSSLTAHDERRFLLRLKQLLPRTTLIVVSHRLTENDLEFEMHLRLGSSDGAHYYAVDPARRNHAALAGTEILVP
jgi:ATP-binding cassette, subfamily B, bacterial